MSSAARGERLSRRVVRRLEQQSDPYIRRRHAGDPQECAFAAAVVRLAWEGRRDPYGETYRAFYPFYRDHAAAEAALRAFMRGEVGRAARDAAEFDGRSGAQWVTSVLVYLKWRSGEEWRPLTQRFSEPMCVYQSARRVLYDAFTFPPVATRSNSAGAAASGAGGEMAPAGNGTRPVFSSPKKPPQKARAAAATTRSA